MGVEVACVCDLGVNFMPAEQLKPLDTADMTGCVENSILASDCAGHVYPPVLADHRWWLG